MIREYPGLFSVSLGKGGKIQLDLRKDSLLPYEAALLSDLLVRAFHEATHVRQVPDMNDLVEGFMHSSREPG